MKNKFSPNSPGARRIAFSRLSKGNFSILFFVGLSAAFVLFYTFASDVAKASFAATEATPTTALTTARRNGKIAFTSLRNGNTDIYIVNPDGTDERRVTTNAAVDIRPSFSPDGTRIAFSSFRNGYTDIYVINTDGTGERQVTVNGAGESYPSFSLDNTRIVFNSSRNGEGDIYVINVDGTNERRVTTDSAGYYNPSFSPDGTQIAFRGFRNDNFDIYVINADGTNQRRVTSGRTSNFEPSWSPDGSRIAYRSNREVGGEQFNNDIYTINPDGTDERRVTTTAEAEGNPSWSPDGTRIVFDSLSTINGDSTNSDIYTNNLDGTDPRRSTTSANYDSDPSWGSASVTPVDAPVDFNGDGRTDFSVVRRENNRLTWFFLTSSITTGATTTGDTAVPQQQFSGGIEFGLNLDEVLMGDYNGDGSDDLAVYRVDTSGDPTSPTAGQGFFYLLETVRDPGSGNVTGFTFRGLQFGSGIDNPQIAGDFRSDDPFIVGDYDGDGRDDIAVYRDGSRSGVTTPDGTQQSVFYYLASGGRTVDNPAGTFNAVGFGTTGDLPAVADYDGDGATDFAVRRGNNDAGNTTTFYLLQSRDGFLALNYGLSIDAVVPGDYDGDRRADFTVTRGTPDGLVFYILTRAGVFTGQQFGLSSDTPVPGDYDGDGRTDLAVIRRTGGAAIFYILTARGNQFAAQEFGLPGDAPTATYQVRANTVSIR